MHEASIQQHLPNLPIRQRRQSHTPTSPNRRTPLEAILTPSSREIPARPILTQLRGETPLHTSQIATKLRLQRPRTPRSPRHRQPQNIIREGGSGA